VNRILVIEDDAAILRGLADNLAFESYDVLTAVDGEAGLRLLREQKPDVVILDLMLPKMNGYEVCRKARAEGLNMPILMLTARGEEADRIVGLDLGADDYVTKPFSIRELLARIRALLRRAQPAAGSAPELLKFDDVVVDFKRYEATRGGQPLEMTRKEFGVLRFLAGRAGEVVTRDELLTEVWGYDAMPTTRTVDNHVASLRAKLDAPSGEPRHLHTVHGVGYKWIS
jgi:DNA-binding response OmpR family regulator